MKKSIYDRALRRWFPKRYVNMMWRREEIEHRDKLKAVKSSDERQELEAWRNISDTIWGDWLTSIEDKELIKKATRMDLSLDDIPVPDCRPDETPGHWDTGDAGSRFLHSGTRRALLKAIRERAPAYRKERREMWEFYFKIVLGGFGGIGGTIMGIIAVLKK
jgi:hypothetical protein